MPGMDPDCDDDPMWTGSASVTIYCSTFSSGASPCPSYMEAPVVHDKCAATCGTCGGQGQVVATVRTPLGNFQQVTACQACGGSGQTSTPCESCGGDGRVRRSKRISLRVPAGVDSGSRLRVRGEGNAGRKGGPPGDLYVFVAVTEDPDLKRFESVNVSSTVTIPYTRAILGTTQKVRTVDGEVDLKIPAGVQPGATLLMAKRGVPKLGQPNTRGDQYVTVKVTIPKNVAGREKELVEELEAM